tara:strand:+ start:45 stop:590 length:546 start_codon:yes stop_codon:yes gene_type:complete
MSGGAGGGASGSTNVALSAKGDLLTFNTASARLPVSATNGFVLTTNSAVADGIEWAVIPIATATTQSFITACSDETSDLTTGIKSTWRVPFAFTAQSVRASVTTAPTGANIIVDVLQNGVSILSTNITIDATTKTSIAAATQPVLSTTALTNDAEITINLTTIGSTIAGAGLKVAIIGIEA